MNQPLISQIGIVNVQFGKNVRIVNPVNLYGCTVGDDTAIGPFVEIQKDVVIGSRCRIQSHVFICELVVIGDDCFISHGAMFINDPFRIGKPANQNKSLWRNTRIGNAVCIGTNATIMPVAIEDGIVVGAGSVVVNDLVIKGIYAGNPAQLIRQL